MHSEIPLVDGKIFSQETQTRATACSSPSQRLPTRPPLLTPADGMQGRGIIFFSVGRVELNVVTKEEESYLVEEVLALKAVMGFQIGALQTVLVRVS